MDSRSYYLWSEEQIHKSRGLDVWWLRWTPKILASVLEVRKCGVPTPGQGLIAAPSGGVKVSRGFVQEWGDRQIDASAGVVCCGEETRKAEVSIYRSIDVPTHTYVHELWELPERIRLEI